MTGFDHAVLMVGNWERARDWYSRALILFSDLSIQNARRGRYAAAKTSLSFLMMRMRSHWPALPSALRLRTMRSSYMDLPPRGVSSTIRRCGRSGTMERSYAIESPIVCNFGAL